MPARPTTIVVDEREEDPALCTRPSDQQVHVRHGLTFDLENDHPVVVPEDDKDLQTPNRKAKKILWDVAYVFREMFSGPELVANIYLIVWFIVNITITLTSKSVFHDFSFPYPMLLTAIHLGTTWIMAQTMYWANTYERATIEMSHWKSLAVFSVIFTINIWLSNFSLLFVSIPVHQVLRTTIPLFTMGLSIVLYREWYPWRMVPSVLVVIVGVVFTLSWDVSLNLFGSLIVLAGCVFSSLKGLIAQKAQVGPKGLPTFDLLRLVCPMSVIQLLVMAFITGELKMMTSTVNLFRDGLAGTLVLQGVLAAGLNFVSFKCAALKNPLTMNIAGNAKQVVTPLISLWVFGGQLTASLLAGLATTFFGALWYGRETKIRSETLSKKPALPEASAPQE